MTPLPNASLDGEKIKYTAQQKREHHVQTKLCHQERLAEAVKLFDACKVLIREQKDKETLIRSGEEADTAMLVKEAKDARENIRANRLLRYEEMARKDEEFQERSTAAMNLLVDGLATAQTNTTALLALLARLVEVQERKAAIL